MILSMGSRPGDVPHQTMYRPASSSDKPGVSASKADDPEVANMKKRITIMGRMIADFDRMAADLDREIRIEETIPHMSLFDLRQGGRFETR